MRHDRQPTVYGYDLHPQPKERLPQLTVGERTDKIIYGPRGEVLKRIEDRPFLGYGIRDA